MGIRRRVQNLIRTLSVFPKVALFVYSHIRFEWAARKLLNSSIAVLFDDNISEFDKKIFIREAIRMQYELQVSRARIISLFKRKS